MDSDAESEEIGDKDKISPGFAPVGDCCPFHHEPDADGGHEDRHCVDLGLDGGEPYGISPAEDQRTAQGGSGGVSGSVCVPVAAGFRAAEPRGDEIGGGKNDAAEEKAGESGEYAAGEVDGKGHVFRPRGKHRDDALREHPGGVAGGMAGFEQIGSGHIFGAIPIAHRRGDGEPVGGQKQEKHDPCRREVNAAHISAGPADAVSHSKPGINGMKSARTEISARLSSDW